MSRFTKCDKLFREVVTKERPSKCEWCGKSGVLHMAHILPKGCHPRLRYQKENILLLCYYCHMERAHKNPLEFTEWVLGYKGPGLLDHLRLLEKMLPKVDLKMTELCLKKELS